MFVLSWHYQVSFRDADGYSLLDIKNVERDSPSRDSEACKSMQARIACMNGMAENMEHEGFDLPFLLKEIDILADELSKLPPSMDRTALELRLAQMRQIVELRHTRRGMKNLDPN